MASEIQELIAKLREAECRRHRESLLAIDTLERNMLGSGAPSGEESQPLHSSKEISNNGQEPSGPVSNVDRVLRALDPHKYLRLRDVMKRTGLDEVQARSALYARSVKSKIEKRKFNKRMAFRLATESALSAEHRGQNRKLSAVAQVRAVLGEHPEGLTTGQVRQELPRMKRTAVTGALYQLRHKSKEASYNESDHTYRLI